MKMSSNQFPNLAQYFISLSCLLTVFAVCGQVIPTSESKTKYYYPYFNSAKLNVKTPFLSVANCYNFSTNGANPVRIPNLYLALYHDNRQELGCLIDSLGHKLLDSISYDLAFFNNRALVKKKGFYGVVSSEGKLLKPFRFNAADKEVGINPFQELLVKEQNYDYYYQPILTSAFYTHKFGLIDCEGKLLVDTIYNEKTVLLSNPKEKKKIGRLYENILFRNDTSICIVNMETGKIITRKWNKRYHILPIPLVYNHKQFYIFENKRKLKYGLIDDGGNILLDDKYEFILHDLFHSSSFESIDELKELNEVMWYPGLSDINKKQVIWSFELKRNKHIELLNVPQYIFIGKGNKKGIFNLKTQKIEVPCIYEAIYGNNKYQVFGWLKSVKLEKEIELILK